MKKGASLEKARAEGYNSGCRATLEEIQDYLHILFQRQARKEFGNIPVETLKNIEENQK